jgi:hypothetical protein
MYESILGIVLSWLYHELDADHAIKYLDVLVHNLPTL